MTAAIALPGRPAARAWLGASMALRGVTFALRHADVLLGALGVLAVYAAVWLALLGVAARYDQALVQAWTADLGSGDGSWWRSGLASVARGAAYALVWAAAILVAWLLALPLCGPLLALLAERVEHRATGRVGAPPAWHTLLAEMLRGAVRSAVMALLLAIGSAAVWLSGVALGALLPPVGGLWTLLAGGAWQALGVASMTASFALENQRTPLAEQLATLQRHRAIWLGFGATALPLCWLPLGVPFAVIGATLLVLHLHAAGELRLPARDAADAAAAAPKQA